MGKIIISTCRRSGTHLAMSTLNKNFDVMLTEDNGNKTHLFYEDLKKKLKDDDLVVYVIRDGRDVLLSCFEWWAISNESALSNIMQQFKGKTFDQFLRGKIEVPNFIQRMVTEKEYNAGIITNPINFWKSHIMSYLNSNSNQVFFFRYEDLKDMKKVKELADRLGLKQKPKELQPVNVKVGYCVDKGTQIGDNTQKWKRIFTDEQIEYFKEIAGNFLNTLDYPLRRDEQ